MTRAFIGLGSNLQGPVEQLDRAVRALGRLPASNVEAVSSYYGSKPLGPQDQPDFVNAVVELETSLGASELLRRLQRIEDEQGRMRSEHWGPRTIDLDLLIYGDTVSRRRRLRLPHPGIAERNFVLLPLREIAPDLEIPGLGRVADIAVDQSDPQIARLEQ